MGMGQDGAGRSRGWQIAAARSGLPWSTQHRRGHRAHAWPCGSPVPCGRGRVGAASRRGSAGGGWHRGGPRGQAAPGWPWLSVINPEGTESRLRELPRAWRGRAAPGQRMPAGSRSPSTCPVVSMGQGTEALGAQPAHPGDRLPASPGAICASTARLAAGEGGPVAAKPHGHAGSHSPAPLSCISPAPRVASRPRAPHAPSPISPLLAPVTMTVLPVRSVGHLRGSQPRLLLAQSSSPRTSASTDQPGWLQALGSSMAGDRGKSVSGAPGSARGTESS